MSVTAVTGAASGIGRQVALALARDDASVALIDRDAAALSRVRAEVEALGARAMTIVCDVTRHEEVKRAVEQVAASLGTIDELVLCAGVYIRRPAPDVTIEDLETAMAVNFYGCVFFIMETLPLFLAKSRGAIAVIASMDAKKGVPPDGPYVASKAALAGFADVLRQEVRERGVTVTTVFPGWVDTPMNAAFAAPAIAPKIPPERLARAIVRAMRKGRCELILPHRARLLAYCSVLAPALADRIVRRLALGGTVLNGPTR